MRDMFRGCQSLNSLGAIPSDNVGQSDNTERVWNTDNVVDFSNMFDGCSALTSLDLRGWSTNKPEHTHGMFFATKSLKSIYLSHKFHIGSGAGFAHAGSEVGTHWRQVGEGTVDSPSGKVFSDANEFVDFHNNKDNEKSTQGFEHYIRQDRPTGSCGSCMWEYVSNQGNAAGDKTTYTLRIYPKQAADNSEQQDAQGQLSDWTRGAGIPPWKDSLYSSYYAQTTRVEVTEDKNSKLQEGARPVTALTCKNMFSGFSELKEVNLSGLNVREVTSLENMFFGCEKLTSLDLSMFVFNGNVKSLAHMLSGCRALTTLKLDKVSTTSETEMESMFKGTALLRKIALSNKFIIKKSAAFDDAGRGAGSCWTEQAEQKQDSPEGVPAWTIFESPDKLIEHHNRKQGEQTSHYTRQDITKGVFGDCIWEYQSNSGEPSEVSESGASTSGAAGNKSQGKLGSWGGQGEETAPPWKHPVCEKYYQNTTK
ncbi:unnamed protein product, partial [Cylicostephanus goldi]